MSELEVTQLEIDEFDTSLMREGIKIDNKIHLSPETIESYAGRILREYKSAVWRGYKKNYSDIEILYFDFSEPDPNKKLKQCYLRASVSQTIKIEHDDGTIELKPDPNFKYWLDDLDKIFVPLFLWLEKKKKQYYGDEAPSFGRVKRRRR